MRSNILMQEQHVLRETIKKIKKKIQFVNRLVKRREENMKTGNHLPGDEISYQRAKAEAVSLNSALAKPYFGKIEFHTTENGREQYYIGKHGVVDEHENIIVVDWRRPLARVYYNFTPGESEQEYEVPDKEETIHEKVHVLKKQEYTIENQTITKIIQHVSDPDSEENKTITEHGDEATVSDEFLVEVLNKSETTGYLKEIIATIQREQDHAIRQSLDKNLIIQGVAGSGKSSIALHRLSFLLYNNDNLPAEKFLILGPSHMYVSSIRGLLPELNLEGIKQATVTQLIVDVIGSHLPAKVTNPFPKYFEGILFENKNNQARKIIEFKGSRVFALVIDIFMKEYIESYKKRIRPVTVFDSILSREELLSQFNQDPRLPFINRVEGLLQHIENHYKSILSNKLAVKKDEFDRIKEVFISSNGINNLDRRRAINILQKVYRHEENKLKKEFTLAKSEWEKNLQAPSLLELYKQLLSYEILHLFENEVGSNIPLLFKDYQLQSITYFDLAPLFYIYLLIYESPKKYAHIVIDEAQDLSYLHLASLKKITKTMTLLGDKDQSIFMEYGQYDWEVLMDSIFPSDDDLILKLKTSYRSTKEIIKTANSVLQNYHGIFHTPISAFNRSGEKVNIQKVIDGKDLLTQISVTLRNWKNKYHRIALIHKDESRSKSLAKYLEQEHYHDVKYVTSDEDITEHRISVLSSYNSKGMEFDAVMLVNINHINYPKDELHTRLLYVMLTRAQQEVKVFYQDEPSPLLAGLVDKSDEKVKEFDDIL